MPFEADLTKTPKSPPTVFVVPAVDDALTSKKVLVPANGFAYEPVPIVILKEPFLI